MRRQLAVLCTVFLLAAAACNGDGNGPAQAGATLSVAATEYAFAVSGAVGAGFVTIEAANRGDELHHFLLARLDEGRGAADIQEYLDADPQGPPEFAEEVGGIEIVGQGKSVRLTLNLEQEGTYVFICFLPSPEGTPHAFLGMYETFEVEGSTDAEVPGADATFVIGEDALDAPETVPSGSTVLALRNDRDEEDQVFFLQVAEGRSLADIEAWFEGGLQGDSPAAFDGGAMVGPGETVYLELELVAGTTYTAVTDQDHIAEFVAT